MVNIWKRFSARVQFLRLYGVDLVEEKNGCFSLQVRSSDATWSDTRRNLRKDHRWESSSLLEREEKEKLFNEHVEALAKKKKEQFRQLLDETSMVRGKGNDARSLLVYY